jgi:LPPG:FO 2-phospho-L-lactate transferase
VVAVLAGGTGGAKLAAGMAEVADELRVIANTGDDVEVYSVHVSPDPDLIVYWLAGIVDERGWGIAGDTWEVMHQLERAGHPVWFQLGDRDLAMCLIRTEELRAGARLTDAHGEVVRSLGVTSPVLPMSDEPVRTRVKVGGEWLPFQEFMILRRGEKPEGVEFGGIESARPTAEVLETIESAEAIVIGPSNPVISIGPILAVPGMKEAIEKSAAPVIAVSPWVNGKVVKGPTDDFCELMGIEQGAKGLWQFYGDLVDAVVTDEDLGTARRALRTETLMDTPERRRQVGIEIVQFATSLRGRG